MRSPGVVRSAISVSPSASRISRAGRQLQHDVGAFAAGAVLAFAVAALLGLEMLLVAVVEQRVQIGDAFDDNVAAFAAVAAVRTAELDELLPPEADAAIAAIARTHIDLGLIEELHGGLNNIDFVKAGLVPAIQVLQVFHFQIVDARDRRGHDER